MIYGIYTIKDELNGYRQIFIDANDETAERGFIQAVQNDQTYKQWKKDFSLWCLGQFDTDKGIIMTEERKIIEGGAVGEAS